MKKKRKKKQKNKNQASVTLLRGSGSGDIYGSMLRQGREQLQRYHEHTESLDLDDLVEEFEKLRETEPHVSLNEVAEKYGVTLQYLYSGMSMNKDKAVVSYYSRSDIQQAIFSFARDRKIAVVRNFHALFQRLREPEDILPLMLSIIYETTPECPVFTRG